MFRTLLFVPASRPERFEKAIAAGADCICIDLEDAVAREDRSEARDAVNKYLATRETLECKVGIRMNAVRSRDGIRDLAAMTDWTPPDFVLIAKTKNDHDVEVVHRVLGPGIALWPLIESGAGLAAVETIARRLGCRVSCSAQQTTRATCVARWSGSLCSPPARVLPTLAGAPGSNSWMYPISTCSRSTIWSPRR